MTSINMVAGYMAHQELRHPGFINRAEYIPGPLLREDDQDPRMLIVFMDGRRYRLPERFWNAAFDMAEDLYRRQATAFTRDRVRRHMNPRTGAPAA